MKPILYVEEDTETEDETSRDQSSEGDYSFWGYKPEKWHQDCVQKRVVDGKMCVTVLSISAEVMRKHQGEEEQLERVSRFCVYLLNKTLSENSFSWQDMTVRNEIILNNVSLSSKALLISCCFWLMQSLRIHFSTSLGVSVETLSDIFASAFRELNEMSGVKVGSSKEPIFNLVPVLGAGNSCASLDNIITCELFALRS